MLIQLIFIFFFFYKATRCIFILFKAGKWSLANFALQFLDSDKKLGNYGVIKTYVLALGGTGKIMKKRNTSEVSWTIFIY